MLPQLFNLATDLPANTSTILLPLLAGLATYAVGRLISKLILTTAVQRQVKIREHASFLRKLLHTLTILLALTVLLSTAGFSRLLTGSAVILAVLTISFSVAGQDIIHNLISGFLLIADKDINTGDKIRVDGTEGQIDKINLRSTRIITYDNEIMKLPNSQLTSDAVFNTSAKQKIRIRPQIAISFDSDLKQAIETMQNVATEQETILNKPAPECNILELADDYIPIEARLWINSGTDRIKARSRFLQHCKDQLEEHGIKVSPPSQHELSGNINMN